MMMRTQDFMLCFTYYILNIFVYRYMKKQKNYGFCSMFEKVGIKEI